MFEDLKKAWREAVDNFRQELAGDDEAGDSRTHAMNRELMTARSVLEKLDGEIRRTRREAARCAPRGHQERVVGQGAAVVQGDPPVRGVQNRSI